MDRWLLSGLLLFVSLVITLLFFMTGIPVFLLFFFLPLIPFLKRPHHLKKCPLCGWETAGSELFCPCDGSRLVSEADFRE